MRLRIFIFGSLLATFGSIAAHAHAFLDHASPLVGSTVASAPHEVSLTFTQNLEAAFSNVAVTCAGTHCQSIRIRRKAALPFASADLKP
jgi:copper resistance protein C